MVTEELEEWEDSKTIGRKRQWFTIDDALSELALHKPTQRSYLQQLKLSKNQDLCNSVNDEESGSKRNNDTDSN